MGRMLNALADRVLELGPTAGVEREGNWRSAMDQDRLYWLVLDRPDKSVNTIDRSVLEELNHHIDRMVDLRPHGVVIRSAKPSGFAVGADIRQFIGSSRGEIRGMLKEAHLVLDRLADLEFNTVAVIHGHCLGAGLELALACKRRIAIKGASLGFPEVMLGLHPGLGGTYRSTRIADPIEAMTMMLTGKPKNAKAAKRMGLVDFVTEERHVREAALNAADGFLNSAGGGFKAKALSFGPSRSFAARQMRSRTAAKAPKAHYPAPYRLIDLWEEHGGDAKAMQDGEAESFSELIETETAQNLVRVFFLRETMKGLKEGASDIRRVHVIGAGTMGGEIAAWAAREGFAVTLGDVAVKPIGKAIRAAAKMLDATLKDPLKVRDALDRLVPDPTGLGVRHADLVIEAAPERLDLKRRIYAEIEPKMKKGALLATNTSAIPLADLAEGLSDPSRLVGLHFFNPVSRMPLIEIVSHERIHSETARRATAFAVELSKLPAPVKSAPGFLVNRALLPYMAEALILVDEGIPKERIDAAAEEFGMPMGPIELTDQVGLDIALDVSSSLRERLGGSFPRSPDWLGRMVERGELGRKSGKGLYEYDSDGKAKKTKVDALKDDARSDPDLTDRLILPMLNAVVACLREGVVADPDIADGAMIFGTGFAPFRGGPVQYARRRGISQIVSRLEEMKGKHGERFAPDPGWDGLKG